MFDDASLVESWMRGEVSSEEIVARLAVRGGRKFGSDFLSRRLEQDCSRMMVNVDLLNGLSRFRPAVPIVLATDNMDCFVSTFERARSSRRRPVASGEDATMLDWAKLCDSVICSSDVGVLKSEDPSRFFGPTLTQHNLLFSDCLLIDDRADNCDAFRSHGGSAVQWSMKSGTAEAVISAVHQWLGWRQVNDRSEAALI
jgi:hypothetical protein